MEVSLNRSDTAASMSSSTMKRLSILQGHLEAGGSPASPMLEAFTVSAETAPNFSGGSGTLTVVDNRTGKKYEFEISEGGTVKATDFKKVSVQGAQFCLNDNLGFTSVLSWYFILLIPLGRNRERGFCIFLILVGAGI